MEKETRTERIIARLTPSEKKQFQKIVNEYGVKNLSEFIRSVLLTGSYKVTSEECENLRSNLIYELNRIGNNLNQIARYANIEKELDVRILEELSKIKELLEMLTD
ncbi:MULTISPECIES: plasmid mobilization relaxosome protein MobC [unclassified Nitratiruptor]|uniref:plasmid mobilization protein n=1 Tax=unclassified Nitratiruptor TaxID=2624044 RepID=UPI0018EDB94B|nr:MULTISPECIES: plasmid mobilization relaxosome protein MobC [unclassified Nitratiruptor]BCD61142.1 hypothetical protein NitYY0810_P04 [Nitratiruptor sp. YY08-10]BCD65075.1 hypothetical protein NitYY0814_P04 [Nitratiruptor sp. YY08-14]